MKARPFPWRVRRIGTEARRLLSSPGFSGRVLAVISTSTYLSSVDGEILWMAQEGLPMHRRCILYYHCPGSYVAGQSFWVRSPFLRIGHSVVDLTQAVEWESPTVEAGQAKPLSMVIDSLRRLIATLPKSCTDTGLGDAILLLSAIYLRKEVLPPLKGTLVGKALNPILDLATACLAQDMAGAARIGRELVGLGPGLSPSGDDFLGGLFFTAHTLRFAYPGQFDYERQPIMDLVKWARPQTHPISHTLLNDLSLGHAPEPLHDLVSSLLMGEDLGPLMSSAIRLVGIGQTSGWDMLAGVLTGMLLVVGKIKGYSFRGRVRQV